ncbi:MAG: class F sortase, partial [Longispora sp.]|nr:class F sortase [Longispora sp. (in: high G+C Gram-positive bacteria)]
LARGVAQQRRQLAVVALSVAAGVLATVAFGYLWSPSPLGMASGPAVLRPAGLPNAPRIPAGQQANSSQSVQPDQLTIPKIGVESRLVDLVLNTDGTLQAPSDYQVAGWYAGGPPPGTAPGPPAVLVGHVDSMDGPAVFFRLSELVVGDTIDIRGIDSVVRHFTVYKLAEYPKNGFPSDEVYAPTSKAEVRLITCIGQFDRVQGSYLGNLIVYAVIAEPKD